jgi:saccharopine dehydrogenase (NAD+, L-lysine-forming)
VQALAESLGLEWLAFDLADSSAVQQAVTSVALVLNAAGPFANTSMILAQSCLDNATHYLDVSNEIEVFQALAKLDELAHQRHIVIMPGVGYGTAATNFLVKTVFEQLPDALELELGTAPYLAGRSNGAITSTLEVLARGGKIYQQGGLMSYRIGKGIKPLRLPNQLAPDQSGREQVRAIMPVPTGDLWAAHYLTGIPNIKAYTVSSSNALVGLALPLMQQLLRFKGLRQLVQNLAMKRATAPSVIEQPASTTSYSWARAVNANGKEVQAWLAVGEGYAFTAASSVKAVVETLAQAPTGFKTLAQAFGQSFVLEFNSLSNSTLVSVV